MKKYELTQNTKIVDGVVLYQIKALIDIPVKDVKIGDLGGYIKSEDNLSHEDTCWIADEACVFGNAWISGDACIFGNAGVSGKAEVYDNARVCGFANVSGMAKVYGMAQVFHNAKVSGTAEVLGEAQVYSQAMVGGKTALIGGNWSENPISIIGSNDFICQCDTDKIRIGCITLTFDEWLEEYESIGKEHGYPDKQIKEYKMIIKLIIKLNKTT